MCVFKLTYQTENLETEMSWVVYRHIQASKYQHAMQHPNTNMQKMKHSTPGPLRLRSAHDRTAFHSTMRANSGGAAAQTAAGQKKSPPHGLQNVQEQPSGSKTSGRKSCQAQARRWSGWRLGEVVSRTGLEGWRGEGWEEWGGV